MPSRRRTPSVRRAPSVRRTLVAAVAAVALWATTAGAIPEFEAPFREYPAGVEAISLTHGDFDEDGLVDAVVAISSPTPDLVFMRQNADHSFTAAGSWTSDLLTSLVAGDFNGDGHRDVAGLDQLGNVIALFGDGAGGSSGFAARSAPFGAIFLAAANLNSDAQDDLVAVSYILSTLETFMGGSTGGGTLTPATTYVTEASPTAVATGDLDGDGHDDMVLAHDAVALAEVLYGDGTGAIASSLNVPLGGSAIGSAAVIADLNGDGLRDVVIGMSDGTGAAVILNTGAQTFGTPIFYGGAAGSANFVVACDDLDGDADRDLILVGPQTYVLLNSGSGTFTVAGNALPPDTHNYSVLALTDFDGDTVPDVLGCGNYGATLIAAHGNGDGTFGFDVELAADYADALVFSDIDGDSDQDAVTINRAISAVQTFARLGGAFAAPAVTGLSFPPSGLATGRFNADAAPDYATVISDIGVVIVMLNDGSGGFASVQPYATGQWPIDVVAGDLDGDGLDDLVVICSSGGETGATDKSPAEALFTHSLLIYRNSPVGFPFSPSSVINIPGGCPNGAAIGDVTQDGRMDIVAPLTCTDKIMVYPATAPGVFGTGFQAAAVTAPSAVAVRDVDGEGSLDIIALSSSGSLATIINEGGAGFALPVEVPTPRLGQFLVVEDFDLDGNLDAAALSLSSVVAVHPGLGGGVFGAGLDFGVCSAPTDLVANDFDTDGDLDLVVTSATQQAFQYLRNVHSVASAVPADREPTFAGLDLRPAVPNPATGATRFEFRLDAASRVTVDVFDVRGHRVRTLMGASDLPAGTHTARWELNREDGAPVPSGVYFARVRAGDREATRKIFVTR
ncbi:MAG: VCBS repeat-containing protein [bacterium]|nr:VCBS repeat-containing protein [bacterium]